MTESHGRVFAYHCDSLSPGSSSITTGAIAIAQSSGGSRHGDYMRVNIGNFNHVHKRTFDVKLYLSSEIRELPWCQLWSYLLKPTCSATSDEKVGIITILGFRCLSMTAVDVSPRSGRIGRWYGVDRLSDNTACWHLTLGDEQPARKLDPN